MRAWWVRWLRRQAQWVAWVRARPLWVRAAVGVLAALAVIYLLPLILVPEAGLDEAEKRLKAENDLRTTLVQATGGAIVLLATWRTLHINREGQITERFTRAIDQLGETGNEKLDVRLGGIYALERIARDSESDRGPIIEVLTAFLREHARWNPGDHADTPPETGRDEAGPGIERRPRLGADLQAVATVLGRNQWSQQHHFDLRGVALRDVRLREVHLEGADLSDAHLERADLTDAHLEGVKLFGAHLERANLGGAHLVEAVLTRAHLEEAVLGDAHLEGARLDGAHLEEAFLVVAHLEGAYLDGAHLEEAFLTEAHLERAYLGDAHLQGAYLGDAHLEGARLTEAHLEGANLDGAHLEGAYLRDAHLEEANLTGAHLEGAYLRYAHLERANFTGAHLEGANLTGAHLEGANLRYAHLEGANLTGAHLDGVIGLGDSHLERTGLDPGKATTSGREDEHAATSDTPAESDDDVD